MLILVWANVAYSKDSDCNWNDDIPFLDVSQCTSLIELYCNHNFISSMDLSQNTDLKIFFDAGNVWGVDYSNTIDESNKLRSSTGVALELLTPLGPLSFSIAETITKASTDVTESFRFQLGTTF